MRLLATLLAALPTVLALPSMAADPLAPLGSPPANDQAKLTLNSDWAARLGWSNTDETAAYQRRWAPIEATAPFAIIGDGHDLSAQLQAQWQPFTIDTNQLGLPLGVLTALRGPEATIEFRDQSGRTQWVATHGHGSVDVSTGRLLIRNLDLRLAPEAARRAGQAGWAGQYFGALALNLPATIGADDDASRGAQCGGAFPPRWPTDGYRADVALIDIGSVQMLRCNGCTANGSNGRLALAPDAALRNVGEADIPWAPKLIDLNLPPYGGDQHPFLIWNLYRLEADGTLIQLGASGFKHAFVAVNNQCPCPAGFILYAEGCEDVYGAFTNDIYNGLSPRTELIPQLGIWGRCGSIYDPDCDGVDNTPGAGAPDDYTWRVTVREAELSSSDHPGARWFVEAWYVVRDDAQIDNTAGWIEVQPRKAGDAWVFDRVAGSFATGSPLQLLHSAPSRPRLRVLDAVHVTAAGRIDMRTEAWSDDGLEWHYRLYIHNREYAAVETSGEFPDLRILRHRGLRLFRARGASTEPLSQAQFRDADDDAANDFSLDFSVVGQITARATDASPGQIWGSIYSLSFSSNAAPQLGWIEAGPDTAVPGPLLLTALLPAGNGLDRIFGSDIEG